MYPLHRFYSKYRHHTSVSQTKNIKRNKKHESISETSVYKKKTSRFCCGKYFKRMSTRKVTVITGTYAEQRVCNYGIPDNLSSLWIKSCTLCKHGYCQLKDQTSPLCPCRRLYLDEFTQHRHASTYLDKTEEDDTLPSLLHNEPSPSEFLLFLGSSCRRSISIGTQPSLVCGSESRVRNRTLHREP